MFKCKLKWGMQEQEQQHKASEHHFFFWIMEWFELVESIASFWEMQLKIETGKHKNHSRGQEAFTMVRKLIHLVTKVLVPIPIFPQREKLEMTENYVSLNVY